MASASGTMVRNFSMSKVRPRIVLRRWRNRTGPGDVARMAMAMPSMRGENSTIASADSTRSSARLRTRAQGDLGLVLNSSMGSSATSSRVTWAMAVRRKSGSSQASTPSVSHCFRQASIRP